MSADAATFGRGMGDWRVAAIGYILFYVAGTVIGGLADPAAVPLVVPAISLGVLLWAAERSGRIPRIVTGWASMLLPLVVAGVVIAITR